MKVLYGILIVGSLVLLYGFLYLKNRNTPAPEGCENLKPDCNGCGIKDCALRQVESVIEEELNKNGNH